MLPSKTLNHRVHRGARGNPGLTAGVWLIEVIQHEGARIQLIDVLLVGEHQGTNRSGGRTSGTEGLAKKNWRRGSGRSHEHGVVEALYKIGIVVNRCVCARTSVGNVRDGRGRGDGGGGSDRDDINIDGRGAAGRGVNDSEILLASGRREVVVKGGNEDDVVIGGKSRRNQSVLRGSGQANVGDEDRDGGTGLNPLERGAAGNDFRIAGGRLKAWEGYVGKLLCTGDIDIESGAVLGSVLDGIDETNLRWNVAAGTTTGGDDAQGRQGQG